MSDRKKIQYLRQDQVDKQKWDCCLEQAPNGLIYGYSFYLDQMADNWDALVLNDYEAVMPLPWKKKMGIKYIYSPFLTAQGGVFSVKKEIPTADFLSMIPVEFRWVDQSLNPSNTAGLHSMAYTARKNYVLPLNKPYSFLQSSYRENILRNIKKAERLTVDKGFEAEQVIRLAIMQMKAQGQEIKDNIERFRKLYRVLQEKKMATTYGIFSGDILLSSCIFFFSHNRAYYILVGNHPDSKSTGASHALINAFIKDHAGQPLQLDFEGSDIESLAHYYSGFGALPEIYPAIRLNRLPFFLRWLKK